VIAGEKAGGEESADGDRYDNARGQGERLRAPAASASTGGGGEERRVFVWRAGESAHEQHDAPDSSRFSKNGP